jgi:uncharacterized protein
MRMHGLLRLAIALLAIYLGYLALLFVTQRSVIFPGAGIGWDWDEQWLPPAAESVEIEASFGKVRAVLLPADGPRPAPALVYFHGNAEFVGQNTDLLQPLTAFGLHVLLVEYPGYAGSDGRPSRASLAEAGRRGYDWLAQRDDVDATRIVTVGRSIGAGPAVELAAERPVAAIVLLSPFSSLAALARGLGAPGFLLRDRYDNLALLREYPHPVLLFHGRRDEIIPFSHSLALAEAAPAAQLQPMDCRHNDCPYFEDEAFMRVLEGFLVEAGIRDSRFGIRN